VVDHHAATEALGRAEPVARPDVPSAGSPDPLTTNNAVAMLVGVLSMTPARHGRGYLDGVRDTLSAAVELLREMEQRVPPAVPDEEAPDLEPLPLGRSIQRIAADLRLTAATLTRLVQRAEQSSEGSDPRSLPIVMDAVGLLLVAAHSLERTGSSPGWHISSAAAPEREGTGEEPMANGNWLAAFVVGVAMNRQPTEQDVEELVRLSNADPEAIAAARARVTEIDDLADPVRQVALALLESAADRTD
jgi:hypothetical protein